MPIGSTNISMDAIATELMLGTGSYADNGMEATLYITSNDGFTPTSGSFHNLNMGLPGLTDSFATNIFNPWASTSNLGLKNWAGYNHDANVMLDVRIDNFSPDDVQYDIELSQNPGSLGSGTIVASGVLTSGNSLVVAFLNTGVAAYSNFAGGQATYFINARFSDISIPNMRCRMDVVSSTDTDGVGAGPNRDNYTVVNGSYDLPGMGTFDANLISGSAWNDPGQGISWNKRTSFEVLFG